MYNFNYTVTYDNNDEYRICIQNVFMMENCESIDPDEIFFDNLAVKNGIDYLYELTKEEKYFVEIYKKAAMFFLSDDVEVGLMVLFSFDFFNLFHKCLHEYVNNRELFSENNKSYIELINNLDNKKQ